jgi:hypothetical protein
MRLNSFTVAIIVGIILAINSSRASISVVMGALLRRGSPRQAAGVDNVPIAFMFTAYGDVA